MSLTTLQREFATVLMDEAAPDALEQTVLGDARADAATRVAIYTNMYRLRLVEVLGEVYPKCRRLLGEDRYDELASEYVTAHPSRHPSLRMYGKTFAEFLARKNLREGIVSLANLEWARYDLFDAKDEPLLLRERLAAIAPEHIAGVQLRTIAASRLVHCAHDVEALYRALAGEAVETPTPVSQPTTFLVWRQSPTMYHRVPTERERTLLAHAQAGIALGALCEAVSTDDDVQAAAAEVFAVVGRWLADGLLVAPTAF